MENQALAPREVFDIQALIKTAIENNIPVDAMERILAMRRELKAENAKEDFIRAMAEFQSECPIIEKTKAVMNKGGTSVRYKFAPLDDIVGQIKELLKKHGFSYAINSKNNGMITAICTVTHINGHSEHSEFEVPIDKEAFMSAQQQYAAALTYAKRYAFCNAFGILTGDEDVDAVEEAAEFKIEDFDPAKEKINFGKHSGKLWNELPPDYLTWIVEKGNDEDNKERAKKTIQLSAKPANGKITPNESVKPSAIKMPDIAPKLFEQAKERLRKGETEVLQKTLTAFTLTEAQKKELSDIHASLVRELSNEVIVEIESADNIQRLDEIGKLWPEFQSNPKFGERINKKKKELLTPAK